ncbi:MAG: sensor histidine kinase [Polyangiales bacterium]
MQSECEQCRQQLQAQQRLLREIERLAQVGAWHLDLGTGLLSGSEQLYRLLGVPAQTPLDKDTWLAFYGPEARAELQVAIDRSEASGLSWTLELPLVSARGRQLWVRHIGERERLPGGRFALRGIVQDISRDRELARLKNDLVSIVSHELRTPLTSILGSLRLMQSGVAGTLSARAEDLLRIATGNAERLVRMVSELLDLEKMERGKLELQRRSCTLPHLVDEAIASIEAVALSQGVRLVCGPLTACCVEVDADRITQVLVNLLANAIKYAPPQSEVRVQAQRVQHHALRLSVQDQGPGIAAEDLPRVFAKFQQVGPQDTRTKGGTGLGLAICKAIITEHGGRIGVDSELGRGTTFWFELPLTVSEAPAAHAQTSTAAVRLEAC